MVCCRVPERSISAARAVFLLADRFAKSAALKMVKLRLDPTDWDPPTRSSPRVVMIVCVV